MTEPVVYLNGEYLAKADARLSPDDRGFLFGDGVYEVVRAYRGAFFAMEPHLDRMRYGLRELRIAGWEDLDLAGVARTLLERNDLGESDATAYFQITRGAAPRLHRFPEEPVPPTVYVSVQPVRKRGDPNGVRVITVPDIRWARCDIKSVNLLGNCLAQQRAHEAGAVEALLVRDGVALEASASSLFGVFGGVVRTAPTSNYILPSITRATTIELCHEAGITIREAPIFEYELPRADELFLAGTTVELMPIIRVDDHVIGDGTPGPVTRALRDQFAQRTAAVAAARV